jgi:hypothetical protein
MQVGQFGGIADEIDSLKRDKNVLMVELVRLRQQQAQSDLAVRQLQVSTVPGCCSPSDGTAGRLKGRCLADEHRDRPRGPFSLEGSKDQTQLWFCCCLYMMQ